jgi:periplasmic protein TonB
MDENGDRLDTANDRFKRGFGDWYWYSIAMAAALHLALLAFWPEMTSADMRGASDELTTIEFPAELDIPPPPEEIVRPATPVIGSMDIDDAITVPDTRWESNPVESLAPPARSTAGDTDLALAPKYVPHTVAPELRNRSDVKRALERNYPAMLRDAGIGGSPTVWFFIDEDGRVLDTRLHQSSGYPAMDQAAMAVAQVMRFSPAMNRDDRVRVWVELPIVFRAR